LHGIRINAVLELADPLQLLLQFFDSVLDLGQLAAFFLHHFGRGLVDEVAVGQLGLGAVIFLLLFVDFPTQAFLFGFLVDEAGHGDSPFHFADQGGGGFGGVVFLAQPGNGFQLGEVGLVGEC